MRWDLLCTSLHDKEENKALGCPLLYKKEIEICKTINALEEMIPGRLACGVRRPAQQQEQHGGDKRGFRFFF